MCPNSEKFLDFYDEYNKRKKKFQNFFENFENFYKIGFFSRSTFDPDTCNIKRCAFFRWLIWRCRPFVHGQEKKKLFEFLSWNIDFTLKIRDRYISNLAETFSVFILPLKFKEKSFRFRKVSQPLRLSPLDEYIDEWFFEFYLLPKIPNFLLSNISFCCTQCYSLIFITKHN